MKRAKRTTLAAATGSAPGEAQAKRCLAIREASKRGSYVSREESAFVRQIWRRFPEWYRSTEKTVFIATAPFGSHVQIDEPNTQVTDAQRSVQ